MRCGEGLALQKMDVDAHVPPVAPFAPNSHGWLETRTDAGSERGSNPSSGEVSPQVGQVLF